MNHAAVQATLRRTQRDFDRINARLGARRDPLDDRVVENMLAGYRYLDSLVAARVDLFAAGQSKHLLELNTLVLCGVSPLRREAYARHLAATARRFYDERAAGIQDVEWYARHADESVWRRAAGVYVRMLGKPQLFIEGNHRTGALAMSYVLLRDAMPPFVLSPDTAEAYLRVSGAARDVAKTHLTLTFRALRLRRRLAVLVRAHADRRYLIA